MSLPGPGVRAPLQGWRSDRLDRRAEGTVLRDLSKKQALSYRVRWDNGYRSVARPGYVIAGLADEEAVEGIQKP